jgi:NhaA family Na+:H+ antiporter
MVLKTLVTPFQKFVKIESLSGILLFGSMIAALILANSPLGENFLDIFQYKVGFGTTDFQLVKPLILWINDGLMAVFFFVIGLEIKRELLIGELNSVRKATLPLFAAMGGMIFPVAFFFILNRNPATASGWGIPMATDIAFSLAILGLLGKRVPIGLKIFLTAFAIVDDLGAVLVIAIFYSGTLNWTLAGTAVLLLGLLFLLSYLGIYHKVLVLTLGIVIWVLFLKAGIHPTIAGVLLAFTIPLRRRVGVEAYARKLKNLVNSIEENEDKSTPLLTREQIEEIDNLEDWTEQVQSPLQHMEHKLHNWVAFLIMPLFALANSGVVLKGGAQPDWNLGSAVFFGLIAGKFTGVALLSWIGVKLGVAALPEGVSFKQVLGVALLAGVGFTMSIFVANLAFFDEPVFLDSAKLGTLAGSFTAGIAGYLFLRFSSGPTGVSAEPGAD